MRALRLVPPLAWTSLIVWFSTDSWSATETAALILPLLHRLLPWAAPEQIEALHWIGRKAAHVMEYGVLAALWSRALESLDAWRSWVAPLGLSILTAALDELHQSATLARMANAADVLLDSAGASAALIWLNIGGRFAVRQLTGALLWAAAAGGTAIIALDWSTGVPAGLLWWSVPAAWIALLFWRSRSR